MALRDALGRAERAAHDRMRRLDQRSVPDALKRNWRPNPTKTDDVFLDRLHRDRTATGLPAPHGAPLVHHSPGTEVRISLPSRVV